MCKEGRPPQKKTPFQAVHEAFPTNCRQMFNLASITTTHDSEPSPKVNCREMGFPANKKHFPTENTLSCRKMLFSRGEGGTWQETSKIAGGLQGSRIKNASQVLQEMSNLASRKQCDFESPEMLRFSFRTPKYRCDFSGDFPGQNLRFCSLRFENLAIYLRLRFVGTLRCPTNSPLFKM